MAIERLYDTNELAALLKLTRRAIERWRMTGAGPEFIRAGGKVLYSESAIDRWLAANTASSTTEEQQRSAPSAPAEIERMMQDAFNEWQSAEDVLRRDGLVMESPGGRLVARPEVGISAAACTRYIRLARLAGLTPRSRQETKADSAESCAGSSESGRKSA